MALSIQIKLFSFLSDYLPPNQQQNSAEITLSKSITLPELWEKLKIPPKYVGIIVMNGEQIRSQDWEQTAVKGGDNISIFPPLAGG